MLLNSSFVDSNHRDIANKFSNGDIPKGDHDVAFKGPDFKAFVQQAVTGKFGEFNERRDGWRMGAAKKLALQAVFGGTLKNDFQTIKRFLEDNVDKWLI